MRPAVITPCFDESAEVLHACHESVRSQSVESMHFFVSDGPLESAGIPKSKHVIRLDLPRNFSDNGNTPRALGAVMAIAMDFNPIFLLDADNWYSPDHVENALNLKRQQPSLDVIFSSRKIVLDDGTIYSDVPEDQNQSFADTSTMCFFESSFNILPSFSFIPKALSPVCDRIIFKTILEFGYKVAWTGIPSLFFRSHYLNHYLLAGRKPAEPLHDPDWAALRYSLKQELPGYCSKVGVQIKYFL